MKYPNRCREAGLGKYGYKDRCELLADYIIKTGSTVRQTAGVFGISKSTVHKDVTQKLQTVNRTKYLKVKKVIDKNKAERHIRGGIATKMKYLAYSARAYRETGENQPYSENYTEHYTK